jgi:hypothetical protein
MVNLEKRARALARVSECLELYRDINGDARRAAESSSKRVLLEAHVRRVKRALGHCMSALNDARQLQLDDVTVRQLHTMVDELDLALALLTEAHDRNDEYQKETFLRMLGDVIREAVGDAQRREWFDRAGERQRAAAEARVTRQMGPGNIVHLGNAGSMRVRR